MKRRKFRKTLSVIIAILSFYLPSISKEKLIESKWASLPVSIDGLNDDWSSDPLSSEEKLKIDYAFKNDSDNLYVLFIFNDPQFLSSINATGMNLWIDIEGKKKKKHGVHFIKKKVTSNEMISILEEKQGPLSEEKKNEIRSKPSYIFHQGEVVDKKGSHITPTSLSGEVTLPIFRSVQQKKIVIYEIIVPLSLKEFSEGKGIEPGQTIKVGFEWGGMTEEMIAEMMRQRADSSSRASERAAAFDPMDKKEDEEGYRESTTSVRRGPKKYSFWVDVKLAQNQ